MFLSNLFIEVEVKMINFRVEEYTEPEEFSHYTEELKFFFTANGIEDAPENAGWRKK